MFAILPLVALLASAAVSVNGHGLITAVSGSNGVNGKGFAVLDNVPRNTANPARVTQQDTSVIRDNEIRTGQVSGCGRTRAGGPVDVSSELEDADSAGLPSAAADGTVTMTLHQINGDGAGPYTCDVSADGSATKFVAMQVVQNVPGNNGRSRASAEDFQLVAKLPAGTTCTGGPSGNACVVRCRNPAAAGPFGSCVAVTNGGDAAAAKAANKKRFMTSRVVGDAAAWM